MITTQSPTTLSLLLLAQYPSQVCLSNHLLKGNFYQTDRCPLLEVSRQLPNHICETVFSQVDLYLYKISCGLVSDRQWDQRLAEEEVKHHVNLKYKLSLCHRPGCWEIYDREMSLFCMPSGEKVGTIYARSTKCGKEVGVWSLFWIVESRWLDLTVK